MTTARFKVRIQQVMGGGLELDGYCSSSSDDPVRVAEFLKRESREDGSISLETASGDGLVIPRRLLSRSILTVTKAP